MVEAKPRAQPGSSRRRGLLLALLLLHAACGRQGTDDRPADQVPEPSAPASARAEPPAGPLFVDAAAASGLDFVHFNGMSGELLLAEITCGGGALFDFDNDGDLDVYLPQGRMLGPGKTLDDALFPPRHPTPLTDRLYRNDLELAADGRQEARFTDITAESGLEPAGYGCGVAVGDVDNDGWADLYITRLGANQLLRNQGLDADGRLSFRDVTAETGTGDERSGIAAAFFDDDRDGRLDLFLVNNVDFEVAKAPRCRDLAGAPDYCGPGSYPFEPDRLFHNRGPDGQGGVTFEDVTAMAGIVGAKPALGLVAADFDGDGWQDVYVANDGQPNDLWINGGDGTFSEQALLAGCAVSAAGQAEASMGVDAADFDGDGDLDVFLAHLIKETNTLYVNDGQGMFEDRTSEHALSAPSLPYTSFGAGWLDYDNDGRLDLLVVNGAVTLLPEQVRRGDPFPLHQKNQLFRQQDDGRFAEVSAQAGEVFELSEVSRGAAFGDVDNDGDPDVLVVNNNGPARLLINQVGQERHWLGLRLVGSPGDGSRGDGQRPRDMLGARAAVLRPGGPPMWRRVRAEGSYASTSDPRLLFGLGDDPRIDEVRVVWPDGTSETWRDIEVDRYTTLHQGSGQPVSPQR